MRLSDRNKIFIVNNVSPINCICPVCGYVAKNQNDLITMQKENACCECTLNFKYLDLASWESGKRPSKEVARSKLESYAGEIKNE
jgi:hypothetical protein